MMVTTWLTAYSFVPPIDSSWNTNDTQVWKQELRGNGTHPVSLLVGTTDDEDKEVALLKEQVIKLLEHIGIGQDIPSLVEAHLVKPIINYIRFHDKETANLAALMGGLVAQEAIKLITRQYIPINNTCVFNGIASTSSVFEL